MFGLLDKYINFFVKKENPINKSHIKDIMPEYKPNNQPPSWLIITLGLLLGTIMGQTLNALVLHNGLFIWLAK
jgi:hypothetical protein